MLLQKKNIQNVMPLLWEKLRKETRASEDTEEINLSIGQIRTALRNIKKEEVKTIQHSILPTSLPESLSTEVSERGFASMAFGALLHIILIFPVFMVIVMYLGLSPGYAALSYAISSMLSSIISTYRRTYYGEIYFRGICDNIVFGIWLFGALGMLFWHIASNRWWRWRIHRALHVPFKTKALKRMVKKIRTIKKGLQSIDDTAQEINDSRLGMVRRTLKAELRKKEEEAEHMLIDMLMPIEERRRYVFAHANNIWPCKPALEDIAKRTKALERRKRRNAIKKAERIAVALDDGKAKETQDLSVFITLAEMRRETEEA